MDLSNELNQDNETSLFTPLIKGGQENFPSRHWTILAFFTAIVSMKLCCMAIRVTLCRICKNMGINLGSANIL
jgi:hypothetical protein